MLPIIQCLPHYEERKGVIQYTYAACPLKVGSNLITSLQQRQNGSLGRMFR